MPPKKSVLKIKRTKRTTPQTEKEIKRTTQRMTKAEEGTRPGHQVRGYNGVLLPTRLTRR